MPELIKLILVFLKISIFSFGGGYVMIGYLRNEMVSNGWLSAADYANIVSLSQMTPGPVGINTATFVGFTQFGIPGAVLCSFAVVLIPFLIVMLVSVFYEKYKSNKTIQNILMGIRPACAGLIFIVGINFLETAVIRNGGITDLFGSGAFIDIKALILFAVCFVLMYKTKINQIWIMLASLVIGIIIF